mgnify:FL=1
MGINSKVNIENFAKKYGNFFENIAEDKIDVLNTLCTKDILFKDPFNSFTGLEKFKKVFQHMYKQAADPKFSVVHISVSSRTAYMKWVFSTSKLIKIEGVSEIKFNEEGLVCSHIDYWDSASQVFIKIPILKYFIRYLIKKFSI